MALIPRKNDWPSDPFAEMEGLQREMNRLFNFSLGRYPFSELNLPAGGWAPSLDVDDDGDNFIVKADLPGLGKEDINVTLEDNVLTIQGEKKRQEEKKEGHVLRAERVYGSFQRSIALPMSVDQTKVKATFKDGVLQLTLPKREEAKPKQLKIDVS